MYFVIVKDASYPSRTVVAYDSPQHTTTFNSRSLLYSSMIKGRVYVVEGNYYKNITYKTGWLQHLSRGPFFKHLPILG